MNQSNSELGFGQTMEMRVRDNAKKKRWYDGRPKSDSYIFFLAMKFRQAVWDRRLWLKCHSCGPWKWFELWSTKWFELWSMKLTQGFSIHKMIRTMRQLRDWKIWNSLFVGWGWIREPGLTLALLPVFEQISPELRVCIVYFSKKRIQCLQTSLSQYFGWLWINSGNPTNIPERNGGLWYVWMTRQSPVNHLFFVDPKPSKTRGSCRLESSTESQSPGKAVDLAERRSSGRGSTVMVGSVEDRFAVLRPLKKGYPLVKVYNGLHTM